MNEHSDELIPNPNIHLITDSEIDFLQIYFLLGIMTARAITEKILINTHFSKVYLRSILGKINGINQLANFDTDLFNQLRKIKSVPNIEDVSTAPPNTF